MMSPRLLSLRTLLSLTFFFLKSCHSQTLVPAVITFGDSAVDVGNNNYLFTLLKADFPPYGRDFPNHQPTGRFCNGKLATDFTAENLGFTSFPPAYLSPEATGKKLLLGANFASAGSGYYDKTALLSKAIPLPQQLEYYQEYQTKLGDVAAEQSKNASDILSKAVYIVSAGSSDFVQNYYINPFLNKFYTPDEFSDVLIQNFNTFIQNLYDLGARRIGVTSLPPFGCLPLAITLFGFGSNDCVGRLNEDAKNFNKKLSSAASSLQNQLSGLKVVVFDIYQPFFDIIKNPAKNGFFEARKACCGTGTVETAILCNPKSLGTCANASEYVFFDAVHPTQAANKKMSDSLLLQGSFRFRGNRKLPESINPAAEPPRVATGRQVPTKRVGDRPPARVVVMAPTVALVGWLRKADNLIHIGLASAFGAIALRSSNQQRQIELLEREKDALQQHNKSVKKIMWGWKQELFREAHEPSSPISISSVQAIYGESEAAPSLGSGGEATNAAPSTPKFVV